MKVGLTTLDLPDETINDIQTEGELEEIISAMHETMKQMMRERSKVEGMPQVSTSIDVDNKGVTIYQSERETGQVQMDM